LTVNAIFSATALAPAASFADDLCAAKCAPGCLGLDCECEGWDSSDEATYGLTTGPLCLSATRCRDACDATAGCAGYSIHVSLPRCFLASTAQTTADASYESFTLATGTCADAADFLAIEGDDEEATAQKEADITLGKVFVTQKADLGARYVVAPGESSSLEVTGKDMVQGDRVMVIDCSGTCGITAGTAYAAEPHFAFTAEADPPSLPEPTPVMLAEKDVFKYAPYADSYCPGNLEVLQGSLSMTHQCSVKCSSGTCSGENCFCDGYFPDYDVAETSALCLDEEQCTRLCSLLPGCHSVDMHGAKNRCYLNSFSCNPKSPTPSSDYSLLVKMLDMNERRLTPRLTDLPLRAEQVRQLMVGTDPLTSWGGMLRFRDITFATSGEFKLCFCDSALLAGNAVCDAPEDYTIEVGRIHSSGLECLLSKPSMTRGTCVEQVYGGLRCYDGEAPDANVPSDYLAVPPMDSAARGDLAAALITFCQFGPEAETQTFPFCAQYRTYLTDEASPTATP
jgi:hypothetical protein